MPFSPQLERYTLKDEGVVVPVVALTSQEVLGHEILLLLPENALDLPGDDMDAFLRKVGAEGELLEIEDDVILEAAWVAFEEVLQLTFSEDGS